MEQFKKFAALLADESGKIIKSYFRTQYNVELKSDLSPVTIADKNAEEKMRELIMKEFPDHGILGEEFGSYKDDAEYKWILDPIDGTKSFVCGVPLFGTLISLIKDNEPVLGVINQPIINDFLIGDNNVAELNGKQVSIRKCSNLSDAVLLTTDHLHVESYQDINKFNNLIHTVKLYRNWGDCYGYYLLATGFADVMIDPIMNIWDTMALIPIVRGAGGIITDYKGDDPVKGNSIIASSKELHPTIIDYLN